MFKNLTISVVFISVLAMLMFSSGCSRIFSSQTGPHENPAYIGTRMNLEMIGKDYPLANKAERPMVILGKIFAILDFPCSFVVDTVLLPFDIIHAFQVSENKKNKSQ